MDVKLKWRQRARKALEAYFRQRSLPRLTLGVLLVLTGAIGFFISFLLLHLGVAEMWIRYPVAVLGAYGAFLALLRVWVEIERSRFDPDAADLKAVLDDSRELEESPGSVLKHSIQDKSSWLDSLDFPNLDFFDADEGCVGAMLLAAVLGVLVVLFLAIAQAPLMLAEVFLDAFLVTVLYRRLRIAAKEHWLGTAIRKTWTSAIAVAVLLAITGKCLEYLAPGSRSIGPAIHRLLHTNLERPE